MPSIERDLSVKTLKSVKHNHSSEHLSDFFVHFDGQNGILEGTVHSHKIKDSIEQTARQIDGVERIVNLIQVDSNLNHSSSTIRVANDSQKNITIHVAQPNPPRRIRRVIKTTTIKTIKRIPKKDVLGGLK